MASKVQVAKFHDHGGIREFSENIILEPTYSGVWTMEENDLADQLKDDSFKKRVEVLDQLIITVKRNGGRLPYADNDPIFRSLGLALSDSNWEIRNKCIQLLQEIIPNLGVEVDKCMSLVLSKLIANIGDSKVTVRRMVVQALHAYMKYTYNLSALFDGLVNIGLENENPAVRREMVTALPLLLTKEFVSQDLSKMITSLARKLLDTSVEDNLKDCSLSTLNKIEQMAGERMFAVYLKNLPLPLQKYYLQLSGKQDVGFYNLEADFYNNGTTVMSQRMTNGQMDYAESFEFGLVPSQILIRLNDQKDFRTRAQAVEDLKSIIINTTSFELSTHMLPFVGSFINFLSNLLDDSNFKIINVTLEIILSLVEKLEKNTISFLEPLTSALLKRMGDNKIVIRQLVMSIVIKMMQSTSPMDVISVIKDNLQHKNSRVRQETINLIIAALLTFPSRDFDIPQICKSVGPTLTDVKRAVRQAALECFATLAQVMGPGQLHPLVSAVDEVELCTDGEGLMAAVQARLSRKQLPKLTSDGLVEYATPTPSSATVRSSLSQHSADTEWIMAVGAGVSNTSRSARSVPLDFGSATTSSRSTPVAGPDFSVLTSAVRPFMSAGRGRNKLPWEDSRDERSGSGSGFPESIYSQVQRDVKSARVVSFNTDDGPPKPRQTWIEEEDQYKPAVLERQPKRRTTVMSIAPIDDQENGGSYNQQYLQKKRPQGTTARVGKPE
ncbi:unnamed protein product, partial [Candidula unifasciata]